MRVRRLTRAGTTGTTRGTVGAGRTVGAVAALGAAVALFTGCADVVDGAPSGAAAGRAHIDVPGGASARPAASIADSPACAATGLSTAAASATVRCYLDALGVDDAATACAKLSNRARDLMVSALSGADRLSSAGDDRSCATLVPMITAELGRLDPAERADFDAAVRGARVGAAALAGTRATVPITSRTGTATTATVIVEAGHWRLASAQALSMG